MAIKSGQILHKGGSFVIDRIQTAGAGTLNIPEEKIYELGNYASVATVYDTPTLDFSLESQDVTCEVEALLLGLDPTAVAVDQVLSLDDAMPMDITSPFKANGAFNAIEGVVLPFLNLESSTYRFGVGSTANQSHSLKGDSIFYVPGSPYYQEFVNTGADTFSLSQTAVPYNYAGDTYYVLSAQLRDSSSGAFRRLFLTEDYTNTATSITLLDDLSTTFDTLCVTFGSLTEATFPQASTHAPPPAKPAAVRGKDVKLIVDGDVWSGVQSFEVTRALSLEEDQELGNPRFVSQEAADVPDVSGTVELKPLDPTDLFDKIRKIANVPSGEVVGTFSTTALSLSCEVRDPESGDLLKVLEVPDARFTVPGISGQVQSKLTVSLSFSSDGGVLDIINKKLMT